jgi:hypothetical protein
MKEAFAAFLLLLLPGCPLQPDVFYDSGIMDSGSDGTDAGPDGGGGVIGNISTQLQTTSNPSAQNLFWSGTDVAFSQQSIATGHATIQGDSLAAGHLQIQLTGLIPGQTNGSAVLLTYRLADGSESWTCSSLGGCSEAVTVSVYDGGVISGSFQIAFSQAAGGIDSANLTNGQFTLAFP